MKLPRWLSKAAFARLQAMDQDEAEAELKRLHERHKEKRRAWRAANKESAYASQVKWKKKNRKKHLAAKAKYRESVRNDPERKAKAAQVNREYRARTGNIWAKRSDEGNRKASLLRYWRLKIQDMARNQPDKLRKIVSPMVPGYLQPAARADVINAVMELALSNKVDGRDIKASVKQCVATYNRQFDHFKNLSIDEPIAGTDNLKRSDLIDSEAFHF